MNPTARKLAASFCSPEELDDHFAERANRIAGRMAHINKLTPHARRTHATVRAAHQSTCTTWHLAYEARKVLDGGTL